MGKMVECIFACLGDGAPKSNFWGRLRKGGPRPIKVSYVKNWHWGPQKPVLGSPRPLILRMEVGQYAPEMIRKTTELYRKRRPNEFTGPAPAQQQQRQQHNNKHMEHLAAQSQHQHRQRAWAKRPEMIQQITNQSEETYEACTATATNIWRSWQTNLNIKIGVAGKHRQNALKRPENDMTQSEESQTNLRGRHRRNTNNNSSSSSSNNNNNKHMEHVATQSPQ